MSSIFSTNFSLISCSILWLNWWYETNSLMRCTNFQCLWILKEIWWKNSKVQERKKGKVSRDEEQIHLRNDPQTSLLQFKGPWSRLVMICTDVAIMKKCIANTIISYSLRYHDHQMIHCNLIRPTDEKVIIATTTDAIANIAKLLRCKLFNYT